MSERTGGTAVTDAPDVPLEDPATSSATPTSPSQQQADRDERRKRRRTRLRRWWARFVVLAMIVAAVLLGQRIMQGQEVRDASLDLGTVTLTSQAIPVESAVAGFVTAVNVVPGQRVAAGAQVGEILITTTNSEGLPVERRRPVLAPRAGIVADDPVTVGSTLVPGVAFASLYDPAASRFEADVPVSLLSQITAGMRAELTAEGFDERVTAHVQRVVPRVTDEGGTTTGSGSRLRLVLVPDDPAQAATLVPGLRLTGTVDARTAPEGAKESVYVG